ncbi:hypothetical protein TraAM80_09482 [Trypanosoma rangeli]|uniref:Uncharacterized protein n=1 Tax=Trypanosoma rangeli TaxID=5698 RepID=A0A3R7M6P8_TRYRA|nr:uncharacterized protein TraAM80_09482 [Trypanosoma rangeli]RNE97158.1 hypothetical protein TraAM80_09482 [Trypanosoma rangeli]|eukprot:RNE97158.1 hypothetical protein TraAM80_09482 [Trypanosoma rangeli]
MRATVCAPRRRSCPTWFTKRGATETVNSPRAAARPAVLPRTLNHLNLGLAPPLLLNAAVPKQCAAALRIIPLLCPGSHKAAGLPLCELRAFAFWYGAPKLL